MDYKKSLIKNCLNLIVQNIKNYIQHNENKNDQKIKIKIIIITLIIIIIKMKIKNEHNNKYFLEKAETYILNRIMLSKTFNRVLPDVDFQFIILKKKKHQKKTNNNGRNRTIFYKSI